MRHLIICCALILVSALSSTRAVAQDDEYYNLSWYSCDLTGHQYSWPIISYKANISNIFPLLPDNGNITFSDDCIEINCTNVQMHFPVKKFIRLDEFSFAVERNGEDEYFDYMEVIPAKRGVKNQFKVMIALREPDGTLQNTHIFICRAPGAKFPPQVPKL